PPDRAGSNLGCDGIVTGDDDRRPPPRSVVLQLGALDESRARPVEVVEGPAEAREHCVEPGLARPPFELRTHGWRAPGKRRAELDRSALDVREVGVDDQRLRGV